MYHVLFTSLFKCAHQCDTVTLSMHISCVCVPYQCALCNTFNMYNRIPTSHHCALLYAVPGGNESYRVLSLQILRTINSKHECTHFVSPLTASYCTYDLFLFFQLKSFTKYSQRFNIQDSLIHASDVTGRPNGGN